MLKVNNHPVGETLPNLITLFLVQDTPERNGTRVARWFLFKPKIPIWVNFGGPWKGKRLYIL
jgi:hypothetical protein